jgi:hypothetical protein
MAAERLHGDDTTVPVLARGKTDIARAWVYVRDDRPFGGPAPPAAVFYYSRDRSGEHPQAHLAGYAGILDGCLWVCDIDNVSTTAFTPYGIERLKDRMSDYREKDTKS